MVNNIPVNGWPQLKDLEAVQPTLNRLDKIEAWKRTVKEETFTGDDFIIHNALKLPARSLKTTIEPIQDLHGYDKPWAGGSEKNLYVGSPSFDGYVNPRDTWVKQTETYNGHEVYKKSGEAWSGMYKRFYLPVGTYTFSVAVKTSGNGDGVGIFTVLNTDEERAVGTDLNKNATATNRWSVISNTFTITTAGYVCLRIEKTEAIGDIYISEYQLESGSTVTSYAPYANECPILGRDSVVVDDTGRNIWDEQWEVGMINSDNGQNVESNQTTRSKNYIPVIPSTNHYIRCLQGVVVLFYADDKSYITYQNLNNGGAFTTPQNAKYMRFRTYVAYGTTYHNDICINISDASFNGQYVPYAHSSATIQLGTTVYGADINWDTGVMTVLDAIADMGDLTWTYNSTSQVFNSSILPGVTTENVYTDAICSIYKEHQTGMSAMVNGDFRVLDGVMTVKDTAYTDATAFKTAVTGQTVCYELATPTTIQLTPSQLEMLKGYNRVTLSDGYGTIELKALTGANWS